MKNIEKFFKELEAVSTRSSVPDSGAYERRLHDVLAVLASEDEKIRPRDSGGAPGGLVQLNPEIPAVIVPDLHARMDFFLAVMHFIFSGNDSAADLMDRGELQIVCVGDGFHSEARAARRWIAAYEEFRNDYRIRTSMNSEMREGLGLMEMVMLSKIRFPERFHFLKGNHENITNEYGDGNYPFGKFVYEGEMVHTFMRKFYPDSLLKLYYRFEKSLPLLAAGPNFLVSHAEPYEYFTKEKVINYRSHETVTYGLTWTDNNAAMEGSVKEMLRKYLPAEQYENSYYFGGHRPVEGLFARRAEGKYIQIHNPGRWTVAYIQNGKKIDLKTDIFDISRGVL